MEQPAEPEDLRKSNPKLHAFYVSLACRHLTVIDRQIRELQSYSNLNMLFIADKLRDATADLIAENPAYADASAILKEIEAARRPWVEDDSDE